MPEGSSIGMLMAFSGSVVIPIVGLILRSHHQTCRKIDGVVAQLRSESAARDAAIESRLSTVETWARTAPNEYANREDFVREALLMRRGLESVAREVAELKGENSAVARVGQRIADAVEKMGESDGTHQAR